jgi:hypothetical protein
MSIFKDIKTEIELDYLFNEGMTIDELEDAVQRYISEQEIIYYSNAIKYLSENDPSLNESMSIAEEFGYTPSQLNSEVLATLLYQRQLSEEWYNIKDDVEQIIEELETEEQEYNNQF